ncbi:MAG: PTS system mannose/fructose/sorbose family transporter subunit IID, partial [Romboutsia sp.]|nr:PTS system mannose/fructose/sorbose family transporter subunit IID [Romboutsia sp.]
MSATNTKTALTKKDYIKTSLRAYFLQNGFNYGNYQGLGYANILYPALKKIYKDDEKGFQEALSSNVEFFNSNPHFLPFITSMQLVMLDNGSKPEDARSIKLALMGPLAGIGDSLAQFCLAPLLATIGSSLAQDG